MSSPSDVLKVPCKHCGHHVNVRRSDFDIFDEPDLPFMNTKPDEGKI